MNTAPSLLLFVRWNIFGNVLDPYHRDLSSGTSDDRRHQLRCEHLIKSNFQEKKTICVFPHVAGTSSTTLAMSSAIPQSIQELALGIEEERWVNVRSLSFFFSSA